MLAQISLGTFVLVSIFRKQLMSSHRNPLEITRKPIWGWRCHSVNLKDMTSYKVTLIPEGYSDNFSSLYICIFPLNE